MWITIFMLTRNYWWSKNFNLIYRDNKIKMQMPLMAVSLFTAIFCELYSTYYLSYQKINHSKAKMQKLKMPETRNLYNTKMLQ